MEIDENLARAELSPAEKDAHLVERRERWPARDAKKSGGQSLATRSTGKLKTLGPQHEKKFAAETAEITGDSKSSINHRLARATKLGDDIDRIIGTSLDVGVEMDALVKLDEPEHETLIAKAEAGEKVTARPAPCRP